MNAHVVSLQLHEIKCAPLRAVDEVEGTVGGGLVGDSHEARPTRGVLVVDRTSLEAHGLVAGDLREQITIDGLGDVTGLPAGTRLRIGGITLRVNGPCEPCTHIGDMLEVGDRESFRQSLIGRRGALCTVAAADGPARLGDRVEVLEPVPA